MFAQHHFPYLEMHTGPWKGHPPFSLFLFWFFPILLLFSFIQPLFLYLEICTGPWKQHPPSLFFSDFCPILLLFYILYSLTFHIWKCALDPEKAPQHCHQQWVPPPIFFLKISLFYHSFSFGKVHISIFGSALLDPENSEHQGWPWGAQQQALYWLGGSWQLTGRPAS